MTGVNWITIGFSRYQDSTDVTVQRVVYGKDVKLKDAKLIHRICAVSESECDDASVVLRHHGE